MYSVVQLRLPVLGGAQIIAFCGLIETTGFFQADSTTGGRGPREGKFSMKDSTESGEPGNYGVGFPTFLGTVDDPETRKSKLAAELANGRLAMMAIIGMFFQDGLTGSAWGDWSLYTSSPLRAAEAEAEATPPPPPPFDPRLEIGVLPPLDFFAWRRDSRYCTQKEDNQTMFLRIQLASALLVTRSHGGCTRSQTTLHNVAVPLVALSWLWLRGLWLRGHVPAGELQEAACCRAEAWPSGIPAACIVIEHVPIAHKSLPAMSS